MWFSPKTYGSLFSVGSVSGSEVSFASVAILLHACAKQWRRNRSFRAGGRYRADQIVR